MSGDYRMLWELARATSELYGAKEPPQNRDHELWGEHIMLHDYPECGPGSLAVEKLYQLFMRRMELERGHRPECWLRATPPGDSCSCKPDDSTAGQS